MSSFQKMEVSRLTSNNMNEPKKSMRVNVGGD